MNVWLLAWRSLRLELRSSLAVTGATAVAAAVLTGALILGADLRATLEARVVGRLGAVDSVLETGGRIISEEICDRLGNGTPTRAAPVLRLRAMALRHDPEGLQDDLLVGRVAVWGVNPDFPGLTATGDAGPSLTVEPGMVALNPALADRLGMTPGESLELRIERPSALGRDAPLSNRADSPTVRVRCRVAEIVDARRMGDLDLTVNVQPPLNAFVDLPWLRAKVLDAPWSSNGCNAVLLSLSPATQRVVKGLDAWDGVDRIAWQPQHLGYSIQDSRHGGPRSLVSDRIYLAPGVVDAAAAVSGASPALYYLVNGLTATNRSGDEVSTPYSFAAAMAPGPTVPLPEDMRADEVVVNAWTAEALDVGVGGRLRIDYSLLRGQNDFVPTSAWFTVRAVLSMEALESEREAVPAFPGLSDVERCRDWDIGMPLDDDQLADEANEAYWKAYGATPKAFVTYAAGRRLWGNRFGSTMAVRFPVGTQTEIIWHALRDTASLESAGLHVRRLREEAEAAVDQSMDFRQLFLSMSFFLIVSAMMLTVFSYGLRAEHCASQYGVLRAVGWRRRAVLGLGLREAVWLGGLGSLAGALLGVVCAQLWGWGLGGRWSASLAHMTVYQAPVGVRMMCIAIGAVSTGMLAVTAMGLRLHTLLRRDPVALLQGMTPDVGRCIRRHRPRSSRLVGQGLALSASAIGAVAAVTWGAGADEPSAGFFLAGALLLVMGGVSLRLILARLWGRVATPLGERQWVARSLSLRPGRTLLVVLLLACGSFMVVGVFAWKQDVAQGAERRSSGTGGFELFVETTLPLLADPGTSKGLAELGWQRDAVLAAAGIVACKVRDGDDASCLNLSRAQSPRIVGVDVVRLMDLGAFTGEDAHVWAQLLTSRADGAVPGLVGDADTLAWGLSPDKAADGTPALRYRDAQGDEFSVALVGTRTLPPRLTLFTGAILIPMEAFMQRFPGESGYRVLLVDTDDPRQAADALTSRLRRHGAAIQTSVDRLRMFYQVEATYLGMFLVLGGLGVLLGTAGLAFVVARNLYERRPELALLRAVGFSQARIRRLMVREFGSMAIIGVVLGTAASLVAILPALLRPHMQVPWGSMVLLLAALVVVGLSAVLLGVRNALRGTTAEALRSE